MNRSNLPAVAGPRVSRVQKLGFALFSMVASFAAAAQSTELPTTVDDAASFMNTKGLIAVGVASVITLIVLGIKGAKLPRRG